MHANWFDVTGCYNYIHMYMLDIYPLGIHPAISNSPLLHSPPFIKKKHAKELHYIVYNLHEACL